MNEQQWNQKIAAGRLRSMIFVAFGLAAMIVGFIEVLMTAPSLLTLIGIVIGGIGGFSFLLGIFLYFLAYRKP